MTGGIEVVPCANQMEIVRVRIDEDIHDSVATDPFGFQGGAGSAVGGDGGGNSGTTGDLFSGGCVGGEGAGQCVADSAVQQIEPPLKRSYGWTAGITGQIVVGEGRVVEGGWELDGIGWGSVAVADG